MTVSTHDVPLDAEPQHCCFCHNETAYRTGTHWSCLTCGKILCQVTFETYCTLCDALIPEDQGFCNDPKGERTFCNEECHRTFYDD